MIDDFIEELIATAKADPVVVFIERREHLVDWIEMRSAEIKKRLEQQEGE